MADAKVITDFTIRNPKIERILRDVAREFEFAGLRVAAHAAEPDRFLLADKPDSIEQLLQSRFSELPVDNRKRAGQRAAAVLKRPDAIVTRRFGVLANDGDPSGRVTMTREELEQAAEEQLGLDAGASSDAVESTSKGAAAEAVLIRPFNRLRFRVSRVKCVDETNGFLGSEAGEDEISMGANCVDESGDTSKVPAFHVADFDDGDFKDYAPPRILTTFNTTEGTLYPKSYFVTLVLAEVDQGGFPDFLNKLWEKVRERVIAALAAAIGGAIGASGGPIGALIGAAVGYIVGKVFEWFKSVWEDDVFPPVNTQVVLPNPFATFGGSTDTVDAVATFKGHGGHYRVAYDWQLARA